LFLGPPTGGIKERPTSLRFKKEPGWGGGRGPNRGGVLGQGDVPPKVVSHGEKKEVTCPRGGGEKKDTSPKCALDDY